MSYDTEDRWSDNVPECPYCGVRLGVRTACRNCAAREEAELDMPNMDDVYGGNTLKAEDVPQDYRGTLLIESVTCHTFDNDKKGGAPEKKLVVRFKGAEKGLALNVTNANMLAEIAGTRDYDYWPGKRVVLYRTMTDYAGKRVPALRLDHPAPAQRGGLPPATPPPPPPQAEPSGVAAGFAVSDDDVPF